MIECSREALLAAVSKARKICHHGPLPILSNVMLTADPINAWVSLTATDLDSQLALDVEAEVGEELATCVDAERLYQALSVEGEKSKIAFDGEKLKIATGRSVFRLPRLDAKDFPVMTSTAAAVSAFDCAWLGDAIAKVLPFGGPDNDHRLYCRGVSLKSTGGVLQIAATNGAAAAQVTHAGLDDQREFSIMLHRRICEVLVEVKPTRAIVKDGSALFLGENMQLVTKLLEAQVPDLSKVFFEEGQKISRVGASKKAWIDAVKSCAPFTEQAKLRSIRILAHAGDALTIEGVGMSGQGSVQLDASTLAEVDMTIQDKFILALLECCDEKAEVMFDGQKAGIAREHLSAVAMGFRA